MKPTLIVGDVHGCLDELNDLLKQAAYGPGIRLIFVGDVINKGPDSAGTLALARAYNAEMVLGNHERAFLRYVASERNDSYDFENVKRQLGAGLKDAVTYLKNLPTYIERKPYMVVHAGLAPNRHPAKTDAKILTSIRTWDGKGVNLERSGDPPWFRYYKGEKLVVYGHWARMGLTIRRRTIGLDSGCVYGGKLSAVLLPERRIFQVSARVQYAVPGKPRPKLERKMQASN